MNRRFLRLDRLVSSGFLGFALLLLVCLIVRLLWRAAGTETGIQTLRSHWRDATVGWVLGAYEPIDSRDPPEQAEYWLREVDRVLEAHPNDARLTMGAAIVLDSPGYGFLSGYLKGLNGLPGFGPFPEWDKEGIKQAEDAFENQCKHDCLELAATAAKLDPTNVESWRLYALLLRRESLHSYDETPRNPDWLNILNECTRHDPDNALYDYLATHFYWKAAAKMDFSGARERLVIKDADKFKRGVVRFEQGQAKRCFSVGDTGLTAVADFLSHTQVPLTDQERIVNSRGIHLRHSLLLRNVWLWQGSRADEKASAGDVGAALALSRENLHLIAQYERGGASTAYDQVAMVCKAATTSKMETFADAHKDAIGDPETQQIVALREAALLQQEIVRLAARELANGKSQPASGLASTLDGAALASAFIVGIAPSFIALLFLVGLLATVLSRCFGGGTLRVVGPIGQASTLAVAATATVTLFGLAPAEIIGRDVQSWFFTAGLLLIPIVVASWIGWYWLRRRAFQFSIRAMLIFTLVLSLFLSLLSVIRPDEGFLAGFPFRLSMPARGWKGLDASVYSNAITADYGEWAWAAFQWTVYCGHYVTLLLWAALLVALYSVRIGKMHRQDDPVLPHLRNRLGGLLRTLGRPALVISALILMAYLFAAPSILEQTEQEFQKKMAYARDPERYWTEVEETVQRIRSDGQVMGQLRESAKAEASKPTNPDSESQKKVSGTISSGGRGQDNGS